MPSPDLWQTRRSTCKNSDNLKAVDKVFSSATQEFNNLSKPSQALKLQLLGGEVKEDYF